MENINDKNLSDANTYNSNAQSTLEHEQMQRIYFERKQREEYFARRKFNRTPLILALIGLILTFAFGLGIAFAIPALIVGVMRYLKAPSRTLRWAIVISVITIVLCVIYIVCLAYAIATGIFAVLNQPLT